MLFRSEHPHTLTSMGNLASTYRNQGRWKEAEQLLVQVSETRKRIPRKDHLDNQTRCQAWATLPTHGRCKKVRIFTFIFYDLPTSRNSLLKKVFYVMSLLSCHINGIHCVMYASNRLRAWRLLRIGGLSATHGGDS